MPNYTLLLIDYEPRSIERMRRPLEQSGMRVEVATDGSTGLAAFERLQPDAVIIEAMLPKRHGFEVCQEIKKTAHGKRTPVIVTTGVYKGRRYRTQAMHIHGADEYLEKPLTDEQILGTIRRLLADRPERPTSVPATPPPIPAQAPAPAAAFESEAIELDGDASDIFEIIDESLSLPKASAPPPPPPPPKPSAQGSAVRTSVVGDLTEDEISARLDALLPSDPATQTEVSWESGHAVGHLDAAPAAVVTTEVVEPIHDVVSEILADFPAMPEVGALPEDISIDPAGVDMESPTPSAQVVLFDPARQSRKKDVPPGSTIPQRSVGSTAVAPVVEIASAPQVTPFPNVEIPLTESYETPKRGVPGWIWAVAAVGLAAGLYFAFFRTEPGEAIAAPAPQPVAQPEAPPIAAAPLAPEPMPSEPPPVQASVPTPTPPAVETRREAVARTSPPTSPPLAQIVPSAPTPPAAVPPVAVEPQTSAPSETLEDPSLGVVPVVPAVAAVVPAKAKTQAGDLVSLNEVDSPPIGLQKPSPQYTTLGRTRRQQGTVVMEVLVDETGRVADVRLVRGIEGSDLNQAAMDAARSWVYKPAEKDGVAVRVWRPEQVRFKL